MPDTTYLDPLSFDNPANPLSSKNPGNPLFIPSLISSMSKRAPASYSVTPDQQQLADLMASYGGAIPKGLPTTGGVYTPEGQSTLDKITNNKYLGLASGGFSGFGQIANGDVGGGILNILTGGISGLFGGKKKKKPSWSPYLGADGQYFWQDPKIANPVGLSDIPGASVAPTKEYQDMANQVRSIQELLPYYSQAISAQKIPDAMGQLAADTATTGPRLALQQSLQEQYGPIFDQLNAESQRRNSMATAANDRDVLAGPGKELIAQALEAAKQYDPEYFATRASTADSVNKLMGRATANLDSGLSATERDEISRGLALEGSRRGTVNAPSQLDTVGNAMKFGAAGRARDTENQNALSRAIQASTAFLPASKSNVDVFQVATGKPSANPNDNRFNTNTATGSAANSANSLLNTGASMWQTNTNAVNAMKLQNDQQNDWGNRLGQISGAVGGAGALLMCWVAREVYGADNIRWMMFRNWLTSKAPNWFYNWYLNNGADFAQWISNKPLLKSVIRRWMDSRISTIN